MRSLRKPCIQLGLAYYFAAVSTPLQQWMYFRHVGRSKEVLAYFQKLIQVRELVTFNFVYMAFDRLMMPLFSQGQHDPTRLRDLYLRFSAMVTVFVGLCGWGLVVTAPELVARRSRTSVGIAERPIPDVRNVCPAPAHNGCRRGGTDALLRDDVPTSGRSTRSSLLCCLLEASSEDTSGGQAGMILGFSIAQMIAAVFVINWALKTLQLPLRTLLQRLMMPVSIGVFSGFAMLAIKPYILPGQRGGSANHDGSLFTLLFGILAWLLDRETVNELRRLVSRNRRIEPKAEKA